MSKKPSSPPAQERQELDSLIFSLLDGDISANSHATLQQLLKSDSSHRNRYRELAHLHSIMEERATGDINLTQEGPQSVIPLNAILQRQRKRIIKRSVIAAAAVVLLSLIVMHFSQTQAAQPPTAQLTFSDYSSFKISQPNGTHNDVAKNTLIPGSSIEIRQGTLRLDIAKGVTSVIESSAPVTFMDETKIVVHRGKAWFHVEPKAIGFTVMTPQLEIIDLGTEFGVSADPTTAQEEIHVFKGKVTVTFRQRRLYRNYSNRH